MALPIVNGARILKRFAVGALTARRKLVGTYDSTGVYVPASGVTTLSIAGCSVQQPSPAEKELLPEGFRQMDSLVVYSPLSLRTADPVTGVEADEVDYQGVTYQVLKVADWSVNGGFWKAIAVRVGH